MKYPIPSPEWIDHALSHLGIREVPGPTSNTTILKWLLKLKAAWKEDATPWCGTFVAHCLQEADLVFPKFWFRAKAYMEYGTACSKSDIPFGAICVKLRVGGGHVFFAVAQSVDGTLIYGLGGNQHDMVNITPFKLSEIENVRWPDANTVRHALPRITSGTQLAAAAMGGSEA